MGRSEGRLLHELSRVQDAHRVLFFWAVFAQFLKFRFDVVSKHFQHACLKLLGHSESAFGAIRMVVILEKVWICLF